MFVPILPTISSTSGVYPFLDTNTVETVIKTTQRRGIVKDRRIYHLSRERSLNSSPNKGSVDGWRIRDEVATPALKPCDVPPRHYPLRDAQGAKGEGKVAKEEAKEEGGREGDILRMEGCRRLRSSVAGRARVNKRPSAVMAASATSDAFRWLFSPGCLDVA